jgi:hypothetical protein
MILQWESAWAALTPVPPTMKNCLRFLAGIAVLAVLAGCSTYIPPGPKADLAAFAPASIQEGFDRKPSSPFPATIVAVRLQGPAYSNFNLSRNGGAASGEKYSVILTREVEDGADVERIGKLPRIAGLGTLNRMLLPSQVRGERDIREAASKIQGDLVLIYTFDTAFFDHDASKPLSVITLGLSPTRKINAVTTASALLIDTRTGFIYSTYEITEKRSTISTSWGSADSADEARRITEKEAFRKLIDEFIGNWPLVIAKYDKRG